MPSPDLIHFQSQLTVEEYLKGPSSIGGKRLQVTASVCESNEQF